MNLSYSDQVRDVLDAEDILHSELERMISQGAISSVHGATRRYHNWLFLTYDRPNGVFVEKMFKYLPGDDRVHQWQSHEDCQGWGCKLCGWSGEIPRN